MKVCGMTHKFGDNVDTDVIIPARYLTTSNMSELAPWCMVDTDPEFASKVKEGDIIVAGANFGCGSSREHAPAVIKETGVSAIIAESFARIFYRNSINIGLPILQCPEAARNIAAGNRVEIDFDAGVIYDMTSGKKYSAEPFPAFIERIISAGGLMNALDK